MPLFENGQHGGAFEARDDDCDAGGETDCLELVFCGFVVVIFHLRRIMGLIFEEKKRGFEGFL